MNKKYTSILFDLDNTLIDTDPICKKTLKKCECKKIADISLKDLRSLSPPNLLRKYGGNYANYWKYYEKYLSDIKPIDPKLPEILDVIKKLNITLGIITVCIKT